MQGQIDKLATADQLKEKVSELQALISSNQTGISSLETKLAEVKATADSKATLDQVKTILANYATNEKVTAEANKIVDAAIKALQEKDIKDLKTLIETAQTTADKDLKNRVSCKAYLGEASFSRSLAFSFLSFRKVSWKFLRAFLILPVLPLPKRCFLPHLSLPCGRVLNPLPSPRPFQKGKGCNRPPVLRTASL